MCHWTKGNSFLNSIKILIIFLFVKFYLHGYVYGLGSVSNLQDTCYNAKKCNGVLAHLVVVETIYIYILYILVVETEVQGWWT